MWNLGKTPRLVQIVIALLLTLSLRLSANADALPNPDGLCLADAYEYLGDENSVFREVTWAEADFLFRTEGTHVFLIGGPWCTNTSPVVGYINEVAKEYGVETIYLFDLRLDGATADTHVRESDGAMRRGSVITGSLYNYLYGEMVQHYLTNLDGFVEQNLASGDAFSFRDKEGNVRELSRLQVPFLFVYNRDHVDEEGFPAPIIAALEEMKERDDFLYIDGTIDREKEEEYRELLRETVFEALKEGETSCLTDFDFIEALYGQKAEEAVTATLRQIRWQLKQKQDTLVLVGRRNDPATRLMLEAATQEAKANQTMVYLFDPQLDGGVGTEIFGYGKTPDITREDSGFAGLYASLISDRMGNLGDYTQGMAFSEDGEAKVALPALPFLVAVNPARKDENAHPAPVFALAEDVESVPEVFRSMMQNQGLIYQAPAVQPEADPGNAVFRLLSRNRSRLVAGAILLLLVGICGITVLTGKHS
ncbi:MAG: hypothetical protein IKQ96_05495 [Lachnospiraceae bacterium]|nr:hypothetical protein [Lachnospiraceae bacterium]